MQNMTLRADERLTEAARERAQAEHTTLDEQFRHWLADYARRQERLQRYDQVVGALRAGYGPDASPDGMTCMSAEHCLDTNPFTIENPFLEG